MVKMRMTANLCVAMIAFTFICFIACVQFRKERMRFSFGFANCHFVVLVWQNSLNIVRKGACETGPKHDKSLLPVAKEENCESPKVSDANFRMQKDVSVPATRKGDLNVQDIGQHISNLRASVRDERNKFMLKANLQKSIPHEIDNCQQQFVDENLESGHNRLFYYKEAKKTSPIIQETQLSPEYGGVASQITNSAALPIRRKRLRPRQTSHMRKQSRDSDPYQARTNISPNDDMHPVRLSDFDAWEDAREGE